MMLFAREPAREAAAAWMSESFISRCCCGGWAVFVNDADEEIYIKRTYVVYVFAVLELVERRAPLLEVVLEALRVLLLQLRDG